MENIYELNKRFVEISKMGWIKSITKGTGGAGNTFEHLLSKPCENFEIPDYNGIEIKTRNANKNQYINMFCATPDGTYLFETKRLQNKYGYPDIKMPGSKVFNVSVFTNKMIKIGFNYYFKLYVDRKEEKVFLYVFDRKNNLIDKETFWSFGLLEEKLNRKMQTLALINATYKLELEEVFYKYNSISFYHLKSFNAFIDAIENGSIRVTFKISNFRLGKRYGQTHDHGTSFDINESDIKYLYEEIAL